MAQLIFLINCAIILISKTYYNSKETDLYYLKSRYYDPETCRFITIDDVSYLDPDSVNGLNLYAYCANNPVMHTDPNGNKWYDWLLGAISVLSIVGGAILIATGVGSVAGVALIAAGAGSLIGGGVSVATGGSFAGGWAAGAVAGALIGIGIATGNTFAINIGMSTFNGGITAAMSGQGFAVGAGIGFFTGLVSGLIPNSYVGRIVSSLIYGVTSAYLDGQITSAEGATVTFDVISDILISAISYYHMGSWGEVGRAIGYNIADIIVDITQTYSFSALPINQ